MIHLIMEIEDAVPGNIADERLVYNTLLAAVRATGSLVCGAIKHEFYPIGFSAAVLIGESHATVHTWPTHGAETRPSGALVDYFTCSKAPRANLFIAAWEEAGFKIKRQEVVERLEDAEQE